MTNKEFQNELAQYPDDYIICIDNVLGWESKHNMIEPNLYINTDIGQIEIVPNEYPEPRHYISKGDYPKDGELIIASYISDLLKRRVYEVTYYPEPPLTNIMDMWIEIPTDDKF